MKNLTLISLLLLSTLLAISMGAYAQGLKEKVVITTGSGKTQKEAIQDALIAAVAQVRDISIKSSENISIRDEIVNESTSSSTDYQNNIKTFTKGIVSSFEVLSSEQSKISGYNVKLRSVIPVYDAGIQNNRLRLAVVPARVANDVNDKESANLLAQSWINSLEEGLVQSRRFSMLDRSFTDLTNKELSQYSDASFNIAELARIGQRAGTDYLVTGELKKYSISDKSVTNPLNDEKIVRNKLNSIISLRIIDVSSGQIKFAKSYSDSKSATLDIINAIYPMTILSVNANNVVIGSGGDDIKVGQHYRVMSLGAELKDPYSGESLGRQETLIGEIEITDVQFKTSQAKIITGSAQINEKSRKGLIIRAPLDASASETSTKSKVDEKNSSTGSDQDW